MSVLIVIETTIVGLVALGVMGIIVDQYDRVKNTIVERTVVAHATDYFIAMLTATPPTSTPTNTATATRTATPTSTSTITTSPTPTLTNTPIPSVPPTPTIPPIPTLSPTPRQPTLPPTARPPTIPPTARPATVGPADPVSQCMTIDDSGTYRLTNDIIASGECIKIKASYVILDCANHTIRGTNDLGYGIAIRKYGLFNSQTPAYVEVHGCRLSNFNTGIWVEAGDHLVIRDNNSSDNYDDTDPSTRFGKFLGMTEGGGIRLNNVTNSQVLNNTTLHQAIGIDVRYSSGVAVKGNTASDNSAWGINFLRTNNSEASGNRTVDNVRKCTWGAGTVGWGCDAGGIVVQDGSNGNVIANNEISGRNGNGVFIKAHALPCGNNNTISGNTISNVLYNAVELGFCTGNRVNNNTMRGGTDGIWLGFAHDTEIKNNTIANMSNHGIISSNSRNNTVSGNQITNSNEAIFFYTENYDRSAFAFLAPGDYRSYGNCLCGNTLQSNYIAVHLSDSTFNNVTGNTYISNTRTFLVQGNGDGNNLQGFNPGNLFPLGARIAWQQMTR
jgi:parallel beta-helix repeat protein